MPAPIAALRLFAQRSIVFKDVLHVLPVLDCERLAIRVEVRADKDRRSAHDSSVTESVPAVAVTIVPFVAASIAAMFCPGVTVTYSTA